MRLNILGIRGIPAAHGGFESFAEKLSLYLVSKGWHVTVFCQENGSGELYLSEWNGINRVHVPIGISGSFSTMLFDYKCVIYSFSSKTIVLSLGYNTALFNLLYRFLNIINIINMDGIEWKRAKWGIVAQAWFWLNERFGCWFGNHLIADHPEIKKHLATRISEDKITMIPYGAEEVISADASLLDAYELSPGNFSVIIARPEPENSFLEMIRAFSQKSRGHKLVVLGKFNHDSNNYHRSVMNAASDEVIFPGAIYESKTVQALRFYCRFYLHGHTVGGTNPSLVEALGAGSAVIAHDNRFNRWVAGPGAAYFADEAACAHLFDRLLQDDAALVAMKEASRQRFKERFTWEQVLSEYEALLTKWHPAS